MKALADTRERDAVAGLFFRALVATSLLIGMGPSLHAHDLPASQNAGELVVYLRIISAEVLSGEAMHELERKIHRGVKPGGSIQHVLITLFERETGRRRSDVVAISATVSDGHGETPPIRLEPMSLDGEVGYGNYFDFGDSGPYVVNVSLRLHGQETALTVKFAFAQLPQ